MKLPPRNEFLLAIQQEMQEAWTTHGFAEIARLSYKYFEDRMPVSMPTFKRIMYFDPTEEEPRFQLATLYDLYNFARWCNGRKQV